MVPSPFLSLRALMFKICAHAPVPCEYLLIRTVTAANAWCVAGAGFAGSMPGVLEPRLRVRVVFTACNCAVDGAAGGGTISWSATTLAGVYGANNSHVLHPHSLSMKMRYSTSSRSSWKVFFEKCSSIALCLSASSTASPTSKSRRGIEPRSVGNSSRPTSSSEPLLDGVPSSADCLLLFTDEPAAVLTSSRISTDRPAFRFVETWL
mmetsp:Transcript_15923/g.37555  ORF Transcript_15923/g.37555 Transcript_15923/m.37555 type:complete len:207 (-) Transcript_15923:1354-1974(-)